VLFFGPEAICHVQTKPNKAKKKQMQRLSMPSVMVFSLIAGLVSVVGPGTNYRSVF
jgi:hypothetical protein